MRYKYILYLVFITLFGCEHHSQNINIKNKPEDKKNFVQKEEIKEITEINNKKDLINIVYSNKGFALIYSEDEDNSEEPVDFNSDEATIAKKEKETGQIVSLDSLEAALVTPDYDIIPDAEKLTPAYVVFDNYELILKWNRSLRFALAVCTLKNKFKNAI